MAVFRGLKRGIILVHLKIKKYSEFFNCIANSDAELCFTVDSNTFADNVLVKVKYEILSVSLVRH